MLYEKYNLTQEEIDYISLLILSILSLVSILQTQLVVVQIFL